MKIAITADLHLTDRVKHPERFHAFENILEQLVKQGIHTLIIAGDLFDTSCTTPGVFEEMVINQRYSSISIYILPGNHDLVVSEGTFALPNIHYITKPQLITFDEVIQFVLIPYINGSSVGEAMALSQFPILPGTWVLVSHGDWIAGGGQRDQYETGTYMPLTGRDLMLYQPKKVFLGHIHAHLDSSTVHYPGSPCPLDPTETGYRSFLIFDTKTWQVTRNTIETDYIFFSEHITVLPLEDEDLYVRNMLAERIKIWNVAQADIPKVRVRVNARGFSRDRMELANTIRSQLLDYQFADTDQPNLAQVKTTTDVMRGKIAELVKQKIDA